MVTPAIKNVDECQFCQEIAEAGKDSKPPKLTFRGKIILGISGAVFTGFSAVLVPFVFPGLRKIALPFIPASNTQINNVMKALTGRSGSLLDIGSGDGRIVMEAARKGFYAHGVELNRWLVLFSKWKAWKGGLHGKVSFYRKDLWKTDLSGYENVIVFGVDAMVQRRFFTRSKMRDLFSQMEPLKNKLEKEMAPGARVVACRFPLPNLEPALTLGDGVDTVWLYSFPCSASRHSKNAL